jgi:flagellar motor switch protein FliN
MGTAGAWEFDARWKMSALPQESAGQGYPGEEPSSAVSPAAAAARRGAMQSDTSLVTVDDLPPYSRSLLRIRVPVVVTLAQKRQAFTRITELGPGAIIQFEKSCEETLELDVGGHAVAVGDAVKVGDKFGLRITSMVLPGERFETVASPKRPGPRPTR